MTQPQPVLPSPHRINAKRVHLRRLDANDAAAFFAIHSDPELLKYWSTAPLANISQAAEKIATIVKHYADDFAYQLAVVDNDNDLVIGICTLWNFHRQNRRAEIGYILARSYWGRGYMNEALSALIDFAFRDMNLHRLEADIDPRNIPSGKILERLGFQKEGLLRERWIVEGRVSDSAVFGLLAEEWLQRRVSSQ